MRVKLVVSCNKFIHLNLSSLFPRNVLLVYNLSMINVNYQLTYNVDIMLTFCILSTCSRPNEKLAMTSMLIDGQ